MSDGAPQQLEIPPARARELSEHDGGLLIDVREPHEREAGYIAGSVHIPLGSLSQRADELPDDRPLVFYCRVGARSLMAAQALRAAGHDAYSMDGGLLRWDAEGKPLLPAGGKVADH